MALNIKENLVKLYKNNHPWLTAIIALADRTDKIYADFRSA